MSGLGTDVIALACILGGAAVGGVVTAAARDGSAHAVHEVQATCAVEASYAGPRMIVVTGGDEKIVVAPKVRIRNDDGCAALADSRVEVRVREDLDARVQERMERARERMGRARERMERAQERMERAAERAGNVDRAELDRARARLEAELSQLRVAEQALDGVHLSIDGMDLRLDQLDLDNLSEELQLRIESQIDGRLELELKRLQERLEKLDRDIGR